MKTKICTKCKKELLIKNFYKYSNWCKNCHREYRLINKQKIKIVKHKNYLKNKEQINSNCLEYYKLHRNKLLQKMKIYRDTHKEERKEYLKNHKEEIRKYVNNKKRTDINFRLAEYLRHRVYKALKGICKTKHTLDLLGCSIEFLKIHLQKKFKLGMTWQNYGYDGWHIDHIIPCARFDLSKPSEQRKCFHYTNLQPLWAEDNLKKGKK